MMAKASGKDKIYHRFCNRAVETRHGITLGPFTSTTTAIR